MTIVFIPSPNIKEMMIKHYKSYSVDTPPQYTIFQAKLSDVVVTMYTSGKVMFQGMAADLEAQLWKEQEYHLNKRAINFEDKQKNKKKQEIKKDYSIYSTIGSDEVGTGDYFGPIVVTATYVSKENVNILKELGVRDSKKLDDNKIKEIAPKLIKNIPYYTFRLTNTDYNNLDENNKNLNKIKAILHNKALISLIKKYQPDYDKIVIDEFCSSKNFYNHIINAKEKITNVTFITHAEDQVPSVAAASIISRYFFLKYINEMSQELNIDIPLGANTLVDNVAQTLVNTYGKDILSKYVKLNYKNTSKLTLK